MSPDTNSKDTLPRILLVTRRMGIGGTENHIARLMRPLRARGFDVALFVSERGGALEAELIGEGFQLYGSSPSRSTARRLVGSFFSLLRCLRAHRPDIVHFFLPEPYVVGSLAALVAQTPIRIMSRRSLSHYQKKRVALAAVERRLHRHTQALIGNSTAVCEQLVAESADAEKVGLIYNGIDVNAAEGTRCESMRAALGISPAALVFIVVANLIGYKGHADLLAALAGAQSQLPTDWTLLVVGRDDGEAAHLREQARKTGLADHVQWLGERRDVASLLRAADIAILPSHQEGFSNSLIEAMAAGLPVIATAVGGNNDAVVEGETGLLVPARQPAALSGAILRMAADADFRARLGRNGQARCRSEFSLDSCVASYVSLYCGAATIPLQTVTTVLANRTTLEGTLP
jgi:glycosyltransferase involved in cell wall biosynthesis